MPKTCIRRILALSAASLLSLNCAAQQDLIKAKSIRNIVPLPAGSAPDVIARKMSESLGKSLKIPVLVENKPGFSGFIGGQEVLRAPADGSALYVSVSSFIVITPQVYSKIPYDPLREFKPLVQLGTTSLALAASSTGKFATLKDYVQAAQAQPESVSFGSFGNGTSAHLLGEALMQAAKIKTKHVPYKQSASSDVIGGHLDSTITDVGSLTPFLGDPPKLKVLAVTGEKRDPLLPDVPTFQEQGYAALARMGGWLGVFAPKAVPAPVAERLSAAIVEATQSAEFKSAIAKLGYQYTGTQGEPFSDIVQADYKRWGDQLRAIGGVQLD